MEPALDRRWSLPILFVGMSCGAPLSSGPSQIPSGEPPACGTIVPLTSRPDAPAWAELVAVRRRHPRVPTIAVINPANGPGPALEPTFAHGVAALRAANIRAIGYVATAYARRPMAEVAAEIDRYRAFYPALDGLFFDEMSNRPGDEAFYRALSAFCRGRGYAITVGNAGADTPPSYYDTVDVLIIYEGRGLPRVGSLSGGRRGDDPCKLGMLAYGVRSLDASFVRRVRRQVGYVYVTDGDGTDPWRRLSRHFNRLLRVLDDGY